MVKIYISPWPDRTKCNPTSLRSTKKETCRVNRINCILYILYLSSLTTVSKRSNETCVTLPQGAHPHTTISEVWLSVDSFTVLELLFQRHFTLTRRNKCSIYLSSLALKCSCKKKKNKRQVYKL